MTTGSVRAVCLDVDETLVDYGASLRAGLRDLVGTDEAEAEWYALTDRHYAHYLAGEVDFETMRLRRTAQFLADHGERVGAVEVAEREASRMAATRRAWVLYDDALPCLRALRGLGLGLAAITNAAAEHQRAKLTALDLVEAFDVLVISGECGMTKPDPAIFHRACDGLGVAPGQAVHVGDRLDHDVEGARRAGLHGVWLDRAGRGGAGGPVVRGLAELPALVVELGRGASAGSPVESGAAGAVPLLPGAGRRVREVPVRTSPWGMV